MISPQKKYVKPTMLASIISHKKKMKVVRNWSSESAKWQAKFCIRWTHLIETLTLNRTLCNISLIGSNTKHMVCDFSSEQYE
jgi:hypothetical protein